MDEIARRRAYVRNHLRPQLPKLVPVFRKAAREFDKIQKAGRIASGALDSIVEIASHPLQVSQYGCGWLAELSVKYREARDAVEAMLGSSSSSVRCNALYSLTREMPRTYQLKMVRRSVPDKSARVSSIAGGLALTFRLRELVPELTAAAKRHRGRYGRELEFVLRLLRDGYILKPNADNFSLTVPTTVGTNTCYVSQQEIDEFGLKALVASRKHKADAFFASLGKSAGRRKSSSK